MPGSPAVDRRELAEALRALRERSGLSLEEAAEQALDASAAKLSRIETEKQLAAPRDVRDLCRLYDASKKQTDRLVHLASSGRERGYWEQFDLRQDDGYVGFEAGATEILQFEPYLVPGLLQTTDYARAYTQAAGVGVPELWTEKRIREFLGLHEQRTRLVESDSGVSLSYVIDEAVFMRPAGDAAMVRRQHDHIVELSTRPNVHVQILPLTAGPHPGQLGTFTVLTLPGEISDLVYLENYSRPVFVDSPQELGRYRNIFRLLQEASLDEAATREWLEGR